MGILVYLVTVFDWERVVEVLGRARISYVWPAPLLLILALYFGGIRWSVLLAYFGIHIMPKEGFLYYLIGSFYGNMLPGVIGGDAIRIGICKATKKKSIVDITASVLFERISGVLALLVIGTLAVSLLSSEVRSALGSLVVVTIPALAGGALVVVLGGYVFFRKIVIKWIRNRPSRHNGLVEALLRIIKYTQKISFSKVTVIFVLSALFQCADILASFSLAKAINMDVSILIFFAIFPIVYILTVLPISLGGLGVREGTLAYLLTRVGVLPSDAVMLSFLIYLNRVLVSLIGGALQVFWKPEAGLKGGKIKAEREAEDIVL